MIPLQTETSYGYVYNHDISTDDEVLEDFLLFLAAEEVEEHRSLRRLRFPNFVCREVFDGRVCKLGNAASFVEPLEATSIAVVRAHLNLLTAWMRARVTAGEGAIARGLIAALNRNFYRLVVELSFFIAWHYSRGSVFDTPFWEKAAAGAKLPPSGVIPPEISDAFADHLAQAETIVVGNHVEDPALAKLGKFPPPFGGMTPLGFAKVGRGIGFWGSDGE